MTSWTRSDGALRAAIVVLVALWLSHGTPDWRPDPVRAERPPGEGAERLLWGGRLDPNRAPEAALRTLPGIGEVRAAAIVAARPYCEASGVLRVRGIGPVTWSRIRDSLEVRGLPMECRASIRPSTDRGE